MAANPTFLSQYKTKITDTGNLVFQPTKNSRLYNAYCRNSSGAGTAKIEIGSPSAGSPDVVTANVNTVLQYEFYNTGISAKQSGSFYYETFKVGGTINFQDINIELEGTFPLANKTTVQYTLNIGNNPPEVRSKDFIAATTAQEVADEIVLDILSRRELGSAFSAASLPSIQYIIERTNNLPSSVSDFQFTATKEGSTRPVDLSLFTKTSSGLQFSYSYNTSTVDGLTVPNISLATFTIGPSEEVIGEEYRMLPDPEVNTTSGVWMTPSSQNLYYAGEVGSQADPYLLVPDLKSKLNSLFQNGNTLTLSSGGLQEFNLNASSFVVTEELASTPLLTSSDFVGAGENKDLIADDTINPLTLLDVHGNKFFPVQSGQRIVIDAPQAESVILVYGEE